MRILYIATVVKGHIRKFHVPYLKMLKDMGWETSVAARNDYENDGDIHIPYCDHYYDIPFERNPFKLENIKAYKLLKRIIESNNYDIIHCHTPVGGLITRLAAINARKKGCKVFYTAHGFHFYKGAPWINWMMYYPVEYVLSFFTDVIFTVNNEDYKIATNFKAKRIVRLYGIGIDTKKFMSHYNNVSVSREELEIPEKGIVLLSVGDLNKNKNHGIIIQAIGSLENTWLVICGDGPLHDRYIKFVRKKNLQKRVKFMGFREDVSSFYELADIYVFPSIREGLPVSLLEAMASGLICVASRNRGSKELMPRSKLLFNAENKEELVEKLKQAINNDQQEEIESNYKTVEMYDYKYSLSLVKQEYLAAIGSAENV